MRFRQWPQYQLIIPAAEPVPDVLNVWETTPGASALASEPTPEETCVWRIDLPACYREASASLARQAASVGAARLAFEQARRRLELFLQEKVQSGGGVPEHFAPTEYETASPEQELAANLETLYGPPSFGRIDHRGMIEDAARQVIAFFQQVGHLVTHAARVETSYGGVCVGRTAVDWLSNSRTTWLASAEREQACLHARALRLAMASRVAWLDLIVTVIAGAGRIMLLLSLPGGGLWLIPVVWRFVTRILKDVQQLKRIAPK
jgi:hypothetical protein